MRHDMPINTRMRDVVKGGKTQALVRSVVLYDKSTLADVHAVPSDDSCEQLVTGRLEKTSKQIARRSYVRCIGGYKKVWCICEYS